MLFKLLKMAVVVLVECQDLKFVGKRDILQTIEVGILLNKAKARARTQARGQKLAQCLLLPAWKNLEGA